MSAQRSQKGDRGRVQTRLQVDYAVTAASTRRRARFGQIYCFGNAQIIMDGGRGESTSIIRVLPQETEN